MFDEEAFRFRTEDVVESMRDRLDDIEEAARAGNYRECARLWWRIGQASQLLEGGSKLAAGQKATEN